MSDKRKNFKDDVKDRFNGVFSGGLTHAPFFSVIKNGDLEAVEKMLGRGLDPNCYSFSKAALHVAVEKSSPEIVIALLRAGADIEIPMKSANQNTPLDQAIAAKKPEMIKLLIRHGAVFDQIKGTGWTPMHQAAAMGDADVIQAMLEADARPDVVTKEGRTPLHLAIERGQASVVAAFTKAKSINQIIHRKFDIDGLGSSPLYLAASKGNLDVVKSLIAAGADLECRIKTGWTPLAAAILEGHDDIVNCLVQAGADIDKALGGQWKNAPLHVAATAKKISPKICETLLRNGANPNKQNKEGYSSIMLAAQRGADDIIRTLVKYKATPNIYDASGKTPLLHAIEKENDSTIKLLISAQAQPNLKNMKTGEYPLHAAVRLENIDAVRSLLQAGASLDALDDEGRNAVACAKYYRSTEIQKILNQASQSKNTTGIDKNFKL